MELFDVAWVVGPLWGGGCGWFSLHILDQIHFQTFKIGLDDQESLWNSKFNKKNSIRVNLSKKPSWKCNFHSLHLETRTLVSGYWLDMDAICKCIRGSYFIFLMEYKSGTAVLTSCRSICSISDPWLVTCS